MRYILFVTAWLSLLLPFVANSSFSQEASKPLYLNPNLTPQRRAADLVSKMTLEEKVLQMQSSAPAIPRLNIPAFNWWNEALHGVAQGRATVSRRPSDLQPLGIPD